MRALTFKGYLLSQLQELSGVGGTSLYSFSKLAENNIRLKDALCLYLMMFTDKNLKNKLLKKYDYLNDGCEKLSGITDNNVEKYVSKKELSEYKTIYDNYLYRLNKHNNETKIKNLMYKKICEVKQQKCITNYRIYKELNLNAGNVNSFLKYGNTDKLSVETVRKVLTFINEY